MQNVAFVAAIELGYGSGIFAVKGAMSNFLKWLAGNSLVRAQILGVARHIASSLAGAVGLWLAAHGADQSVSADATQAIVLLVSAAASYGLSWWDKDNVADKIAVAAATGASSEGAAVIKAQVDQAVSDTAKVQEAVWKVKDAITKADTDAPQTMTDELARLRAGKG